MKERLRVAVLGAGHRGQDVYGRYLLEEKDRVEVVALAEPHPHKRSRMARDHGISQEHCFSHWKELLAQEKMAHALLITTPDHEHYEPAMEALEQGYHILLEKPISHHVEENLSLLKKSKESGRVLLVAHVLRYTEFFQRIHELLKEEAIGVLNYINYTEEIGFFHFAHSYVRGNWRNEEVAAPIILAKSCHDMDIIYSLTGRKALSIFSRGNLNYFHRGFQPKGASDDCLSCVYVKTCVYSAPRIYIGKREWPTSAITDDMTLEGIDKALREGPYGRCVFACDNSVPETQTVDMLLEGGLHVQFALTAFSKDITRRISFKGSHGELNCNLWENVLELRRFQEETICEEFSASTDLHGGGDRVLLHDFIRLCLGEERGPNLLEDVVESHLMAIAAEESRRRERVIDMREWREGLKRA